MAIKRALPTLEFKEWPKTPRLNRGMVITEKIDGTNSCIIVMPLDDDLDEYEAADHALGGLLIEVDDSWYVVGAQSRKRLIQPGSTDNANFARWVWTHAEELVRALGPGRHFGEWWGTKIQRGYNQVGKKHFSLFNVKRYGDIDFEAYGLTNVHTVPVLYEGPFDTVVANTYLAVLREKGSFAAPGYMYPEGIIVFHDAAQTVFKALLDGDDISKTEYEAVNA